MQAHGFRVYFTPLFEVLFTFPSRYWFTIGLRRVFSLGGWSRLFHARFLVSRVTQDSDRLRQKVAYGIITLYDAPFQDTSAFLMSCHVSVLQPRYCRNNIGLGCSRFARHYFGNHYCFLLLWVLRCFSSPRSPSALHGMVQSSRTGLPHSDICGSIRICQSPQLFAAYHVLHRLPEPRHPPCALIHFLFAVRFHTKRIAPLIAAALDKY